MRPKKFILLYCSNPERLSTLAFVLRLHPYNVTAVHNGGAAVEIGARRDAALACCVLVHSQQGDLAGRLIHRLLESGFHIPLLLVDRVGDLAPVRYADMVLYGRNTTTAHILAALQALCRRRSGPKPRCAA